MHAWGQVLSFPAPPGLEPERLRASLNGMLGPEIVVRDAELVPAGFDARRSAQWRHYRFTVVNRPEPDPFLARYAWWVAAPLELRALHLAADPFVGEHDFASFCRKPTGGGGLRRRVMQSRWSEAGDGVLPLRGPRQRVLLADGAVHGRARWSTSAPGSAGPARSWASCARPTAPAPATLAPAHGLCLWEVGYA